MMQWWQSLSVNEQLAAIAGVMTAAALLLDLAFGDWPWLPSPKQREPEPDPDRRREELTIAATFSQASSFSRPAAKGFQRRTEPRESSQ